MLMNEKAERSDRDDADGFTLRSVICVVVVTEVMSLGCGVLLRVLG